MFLKRWRARRAIATRSSPSPVVDVADPRLRRLVEALGEAFEARDSLGDPSWHYRWDGARQLVGLDARARSVTDVRQRLLRLVHECDLRHMAAARRRVLAVLLCAPQGGEGLSGFHARLWEDRGEVGEADWRAARRRIAVLMVDESGAHAAFGGDVATRTRAEAAAEALGVGAATTPAVPAAPAER